MRAFRLHAPRAQPAFEDVAEPTAEAGQVVVRVAGCGLCHTDVGIIAREAWGDRGPPFTLGHEIAGVVEQVGAGVGNVRVGEAVAVLPAWGSCGRCHPCRMGEENMCLAQTAILGAGLGYDGGLASHVRVPDTRYVVPLPETLDPIDAAPLTDAGVTTYVAIKPALRLLYPGATAVVIGVGGLGLFAVQFLRQLAVARVVAIDASSARLDLAREYGADVALPAGDDDGDALRRMTQGQGVQFVIDCVGIPATMTTGIRALARNGRMTVVGAGPGDVAFGFHAVPAGTELATSFNGGTLALKEVLDMAATGRIRSPVDRYPLSDVARAYDDMQHGRLRGRAVAIPD